MKIKGLLISMLACTALVGCTNSDDVVNNENLANGREFKTKVKLIFPAEMGSRAQDPAKQGEFDHGTESESAVTEAWFTFYNASGDYVGISKGTELTETDKPAGDNIEKEIAVTITASTTPTALVAFINPTDAFKNEVTGKSLSALKGYVSTSTITSITGANKFLMVNSTYMDGTKEVKETLIPSGALADITTNTKAEPEITLNIYVERIAAKVTLTENISNTEKTYTPEDGTAKTLYIVTDENKINEDIAIEVIGWELNNTNNDFYVLKQIKNNWADTWYGDYRTFWGEDNDHSTGTYYTAETTSTLSLNSPIDYEDIKNNIGTADYCLPNTVAPSNSAIPHNSYTEAVVAAQYYHWDGTSATALEENENIYSIDNKIYTEKAGAETNIFNEIAARLTQEGGFYYISETQGLTTLADDNATAVTAADFKIEAGTSFANHAHVKGTVKLANSSKYLYKLGENKALTQLTAEEVTGLLGGLFGSSTIYVYKGGICYYQIPIRQFPVTVTNVNAEGYVGVVRNHSYLIDITKIEGLGEPTTPDAPIFDDDDDPTKTYKMKAVVRSLQWAVVKQSVTLK